MQKYISKGSAQSNNKRVGFINQEGNEGFKQVFDYQKFIKSHILWTSKDTLCRIIPGNDGSNLFKQVINADIWTEEADQTEFLSDTFYMTQTVSKFGDSGVDLCTNLSPNSDEAQMYGDSPINYFANTIHRVMRAVQQGKPVRIKYDDKWRQWTNMNGILPFPKPTLFFQAVCFNVNGRPCKKSIEDDSEDAPLYCVVGLDQKQSIQSLMKALVYPKDMNMPIGSNNNNYGPLAEAEGNLLYLNAAVSPDGRKYLKPSVQSSTEKGWNPQRYDLSEVVCKTLWNPWDRLIKFLTLEEQLDLLCSEFGSTTVEYVLSLSSVWKDVNMPSKGKSRVAVPPGTPKKDIKATPPGIPGIPSMPSVPKIKEDTTLKEPDFNSPGMSGTIQMDAVKAELEKIKASAKGNVADQLLGDDLSDLDDELGDLKDLEIE